jgi:hypothetical protein
LSSAKPGKLARPQDVVPQRDGLGLAGQAADHRAEEPDAVRGLEVDDRCPDVLAGQRQGLVRLAAQLGVERGVVQRVGEFGRQAGPQTGWARRRSGTPPGSSPRGCHLGRNARAVTIAHARYTR